MNNRRPTRPGTSALQWFLLFLGSLWLLFQIASGHLASLVLRVFIVAVVMTVVFAARKRLRDQRRPRILDEAKAPAQEALDREARGPKLSDLARRDALRAALADRTGFKVTTASDDRIWL